MSYFKTSEFACKCCGEVIVSGYLIHLLNNLREGLGKPMIINSGYRCAKHNKKVGSKPTSAHRRGTAADIKCLNDADRFKMIDLAYKVGFKRIGVYADFIHLDVDESLSQRVLWGN